MDFGANISKRRIKSTIHNEFTDGYIYFDLDKRNIISFCLWKRQDSNLEVLFSNLPNSKMIIDIERYCHENKISNLFVKPNFDFENYTKFGFKFDTEGRMIKHIRTTPIRKDKSIPMTKQNYPMIASIMPIYHE